MCRWWVRVIFDNGGGGGDVQKQVSEASANPSPQGDLANLQFLLVFILVFVYLRWSSSRDHEMSHFPPPPRSLCRDNSSNYDALMLGVPRDSFALLVRGKPRITVWPSRKLPLSHFPQMS